MLVLTRRVDCNASGNQCVEITHAASGDVVKLIVVGSSGYGVRLGFVDEPHNFDIWRSELRVRPGVRPRRRDDCGDPDADDLRRMEDDGAPAPRGA